MKFLANFAPNYWPDGTRIETKRSHSPKVEGKKSEKRASVVGFARVLVESERVEKSNLKNFFCFFFSLVSLSLFPSTLFLTHYYSKERAPNEQPSPTKGRYSKSSAKRCAFYRLFFFSSVRTTTKKQPTNSLWFSTNNNINNNTCLQNMRRTGTVFERYARYTTRREK